MPAKWDVLMKEGVILLLESRGLSVERNKEVAKVRLVDVYAEGEPPSAPESSWLSVFRRRVAGRVPKMWVIELKSPTQHVTREHLREVVDAKLLLAILTGSGYADVGAVLAVPRPPERGGRLLELAIGGCAPAEQVAIAEGIYEIRCGCEAFSVFVVAYDEIDPGVEGNEALALFSSDIERRVAAAKRILSMKNIYRPDSYIFIYASALFPEGIEVAGPEIPSDRLAKFVDVVGPEKFAEALGPDRLAKFVDVVGPEKFAEALGPDRLAKLIEVLKPEAATKILRVLLRKVPREVIMELLGDGGKGGS